MLNKCELALIIGLKLPRAGTLHLATGGAQYTVANKGRSPSYCWVVHTRLSAQETSGGLGGCGPPSWQLYLPGCC